VEVGRDFLLKCKKKYRKRHSSKGHDRWKNGRISTKSEQSYEITKLQV
jgi:hypothetical protein